MKLFIFKLKLILYLGEFLFSLAFIQLKKFRFFFLSTFVGIIILSLILFFFTKNKINNKESVKDESYSPTRPELYVKSVKTESEIQKEILYWEKIIYKQPNSRDTLINLSLLKKLSNQDEEASKLWDKAKLIDPNNPVFQD